MRFEGPRLAAILREQTKSISICDAAGMPFRVCSGLKEFAEALGCQPEKIEFSLRGFFGIGNARRIRYVQATSPTVWGPGWLGNSRTTRPTLADGRGKRMKGQRLGASKATCGHLDDRTC